MSPNYVERAEEVERLARLARTMEERLDFLRIAEIWRRLAADSPTSQSTQLAARRNARTDDN